MLYKISVSLFHLFCTTGKVILTTNVYWLILYTSSFKKVNIAALRDRKSFLGGNSKACRLKISTPISILGDLDIEAQVFFVTK
jgi:hypothetical protein